LVWTIQWDERAAKELKSLDKSMQKKVLKFLHLRIAKLENPRVFGKPLSYEKFGLWRYRIESFRLICKINDSLVTILVVQVGHRKNIYS
jgi:mRNA interferase RelE/StbE